MTEHYPTIIVQDRYNGTYSGGKWWAVSSYDQLSDNGRARLNIVMDDETGPNGSDVPVREFWTSPPPWIATGATPDQALSNLLQGEKT